MIYLKNARGFEKKSGGGGNLRGNPFLLGEKRKKRGTTAGTKKKTEA